MATDKTDVVIVGLGAAGGILAAELGKAGMKVIGLERGPRLTTADFTPHDELRYFQRQDLRPNAKRQPVTWRPNAHVHATPLPVLNYGNQAGGGTVHYGAVSWRFHEDDFRARSQTVERYGAQTIPEESSLVDWPLTYADLEPFYDRAEYELGVSGRAGNLQGRRIDGGNVFEAPRRREYPLPPLLADQSGVLFDAGARKLGCHPFSTPRAILSRPYQGRPGCTYCGFCQAFGCHIGAKSSILVTKLPEADATGNVRLITGAMCYRVNSDTSGRVTGLAYYGPDGSDNTIEAEIVILAPFIYDNTRLLLLSRTTKLPNGLANSSGQVGKHVMAHISPRVFATFDDRFVNMYMGPSAQKHTLDDFNADNFDHRGLAFHPWRPDLGYSGGPGGRPDRRGDEHEPAAGDTAVGRSVSRLPREVLRAARRSRGADREPAVRRSDDRSRSGCARSVGLARAAPDLRLAAAQRAGTRRIHAREAGGSGARDGSNARVARAARARFPGGAPRGGHAHGKRPGDVGREPLRPELGHPESVHHRQLDVSNDERLQSDAHDPGARLHERRGDCESLQEKSWTARIACNSVVSCEL